MNDSLRSLVLTPALILACAMGLTGCSTVGYYAQAVNGHFKLMWARESVEKLLEDEKTDSALKAKLQLLVDARRYATGSLSLPENNSYSSYVDTGREYITWNVVATPEFSLSPKTWCFPIAGCVSYRGYFAQEKANSYAEVLKSEGNDVIVGGATAYSTLGWFDDPLVNTMMRGGELRLIGTLFHELAHQKLYVKNDSNFNEAFASFVEQQGVRQWLTDKRKENSIPAYDAYLQRQLDFGELLKNTRQELVNLYQEAGEDDSKRSTKKKIFESMRENYHELKAEWAGYSGYDSWFKRELNNARLVSVATYRMWVPAFTAMFEDADSEFPVFYMRAKEVAQLDKGARTRRLEQYLAR